MQVGNSDAALFDTQLQDMQRSLGGSFAMSDTGNSLSMGLGSSSAQGSSTRLPR